MSLPKKFFTIWQTATFRLAAIFALIFGIGSAILLLVLDIAIARFAEDEIRDALNHQMAIMRADVKLEGGSALANVLKTHSNSDKLGRYKYLVIPSSGPLFSNGLPETVTAIEGFDRLNIPNTQDKLGKTQENISYLVLTERTVDGTFLAVGRDTSPLEELRIGLNHYALLAGIGLILLSILAGSILGMLFLRRLEGVNMATSRIIAGNIAERLPPIGFGQEFEELAGNLNTMLDKLESAMVSVRQVSTDLAHDLRTPLTRLRNRLEEALDRSSDNDELIRDAIEEADEILLVFNALLRLVQLEGNKIKQNFQDVDLNELIERIVEIYQPAAEESNRTLLCKITGKLFLHADPALLNQLLTNLVDNALSHTPAGTVVTLEANSSPEGVILSVYDNGHGIPDEELINVTKRFYRVDASRSTPGFGLGLTLVSAIAEVHGAKLNISNTHPGFLVEIIFPTTTIKPA